MFKIYLQLIALVCICLFVKHDIIAQTTVWDGTSWSAGVPDQTKDVTILGNGILSKMTLGASGFQCKDLKFNSPYTIEIDIIDAKITIFGNVFGGGTWINTTGDNLARMMIRNGTISVGEFNVPSNTMFFVYPGPTTTNGYLVLDPGASLSKNAVSGISGEVSIKQNGGSSTKYNLWSSPIFGASLGTVFSGATNLYKFADGGDDALAWSVASGVMSPAKGYMITGTAGLTRTFTGTIHSTDQTYNPTSTGFCLVGNPFPSIFDLGSFFSDNAHLSGLAALWVDDGSAGAGYGKDDYASWTSLGGTAASSGGATPNGYLLPGQGFFINVQSLGAINFSVSNHITELGANNPGAFFKQSSPIGRIRLNLTNPDSNYNEMLVGFTDSATNSYDRLYDGKKMLISGNIGIYSLLNNEPYTIQGYPKLNSNKIIKLGVFTNSHDDYSIELKDTENLPSGTKLFLEDNVNNVLHDLSQGPYNVNLVQDTFENRFYLHVELLTTSDNTLNTTESDISFTSTSKQLIIDNIWADKSQISLFDLSGKLVYSDNFDGELYKKSHNLRGIYIVKVLINSACFYKKVYLY